MKTNLFKGAKFGDKFLTRDNKKACLISVGDKVANLCLEDGYLLVYQLNGMITDLASSDYDIVSKYQEPIDEGKLDKTLDYLQELRKSAKGISKTGGWYWLKSAKWGYSKTKEK